MCMVDLPQVLQSCLLMKYQLPHNSSLVGHTMPVVLGRCPLVVIAEEVGGGLVRLGGGLEYVANAAAS